MSGHPNAWGYVDNDDINKVFSDLDLNPSDYTNVSVFANCNWGGAWAVATGAQINGKYLTVSNLTLSPGWYTYGSPTHTVPYLPIPDEQWSFTDVYIHERLHNFGHPHSNGLDCGTNRLLFPCVNKEYENPFDVMGTRNPGFQVNAHQMKTRGLRPESQFLTITKPGIYRITNLETSTKNVIGAFIKIPEIQTPVFMVEHRIPMGFDRNLINPKYSDVIRGLLIYSSISPNGSYANYSDQYRIIDPYPSIYEETNLPFLQRVATRSIVPEKPYFDPITGVKITVLRQSTNKIDSDLLFKVDFNVEERMCMKTPIRNLISDLSFVVNSVDYKSTDTPIVNPGDLLNIRANLRQGENPICPKTKFQTTVKNTSIISSWIIPKPDTDFPDGCGFPVIPKGKTTPILSSFQNTWYNIDGGSLVTGNMRVPEDAQPGVYEFPVFYFNPVTGEEFTSNLSFQIPLPGKKLKLIKR